ncbi:unnamed protein product [Darwinula stevensoni]|uniref:SSD domain-containing protein n=1 Tax=Darwinula stevensoni TaxID=69355 RepID=A0A7R8X8N8_9CRUS|nr:unnamed protein product [Darwinula stevensoni]CAG0883652.1 unnamed protein product [Darwinula stevensoni]
MQKEVHKHTLMHGLLMYCIFRPDVQLGVLLARRPWFFILASVALSSGLSSGLLFWRMYNSENVETWFLPEAPLYQTDMWIRENFPEGVRYEQVIVAGPNVLTPEYFKYMAALDRKIRSVEAGGFAWVDVCARPDEFLEGKIKEKRRKRGTPNLLSPDESSVHQRQENTTTIATEATSRIGYAMPAAAKTKAAQPEPEEITGESAQYDDYSYGWKEDSNEDVFGGDEKGKEKIMYEDKCIYSSSLLLWDEDFDFSAITKEEIRDKITRALDDESMRDVDVILSGVERDAEGRVVGATAVLSIDPISEPWEAKFLDAIFHNVIPRPLGLEVYVASARSYRDGITSVMDNNTIYFVLGFVFITIYLAASMGKFNLLQQRIYLGLATVMSIGMTILSAFGVCLYVGLLPAELHNLMPFLILGIGIDDTLVIIQCLENVVNAGRILKAEERVEEALKQAGVSITITTLTDIFAFGVGATTVSRMPSHFHLKHSGSKPSRGLHAVVVVLVTVGLLGVNCWGLSGLTNEFDRSWFLDKGYLREFLTALQELFPESGYRAEFYIGDVDYFRERESLLELYKRLDGLPGVRDGSVEFWYKAFMEYLKDEKEYPKTEAEFKDNVSTFLVFSKKGRKYLRDVQYTGNLLLDFNITASRGRYQHIHFNDGMEKRRGIDEVEEVLHSVRFRFRDPFRGCLGPDYLAIRSNQASDADLWSRSGDVVSEELIKNLGLTLAGVFVVVLLMVGDLRVSLWVFTCILFTLIGIAGGIRFAGLTVEIMTSILMILSVGLAVDYSTHIAHKFMVTYSDSKDARVRITLTEIGPPVFKGGLTTMMAFMFCFWSTNYLFKVTLTVIWLSVIYGLYHGLIYLPVMLSWFGHDPFVDIMPSMKNSTSTDVLEMNLEDTEEGKLPIVPTKNYSTISWKVLWKKSKGEYPMGSEPGHPQLEVAGGHESSLKIDRKEGCAVASYRQRRVVAAFQPISGKLPMETADLVLNLIVETWFLPEAPLYQTDMWIQENFPEGVRYEQVIVAGPTVLTPEYFKYIDPISEPWESRFLDAIFHNVLHWPLGLEVYVASARSYRDGITAVIDNNRNYFVLGFVFITIYLAASMGKFNLLQQRIYLGLATVMSIGMTILSAFGACLYVGLLPAELHNLMPFLILGIGIDDTLCLENVVNAGGILKAEERVGEALKQAGVSITITTLTDIIAFGVGATTVSRLPDLFHLKYSGSKSSRGLHAAADSDEIRLGILLARRPWFFILASVALSSGLSSGLLFWRMYNSENVETWFLPEAPLYQTEMWIRENFPEGVRYEQVIVAGPNVLKPEYFKYMAALDRKIRSVEAGGFAWVDVCARPDEFLEGKIKEKRRKRDTPNLLSPDESSVHQVQATAAKTKAAQPEPEGITGESAQYDDYSYGWKEDSNEDVFGGDEKGKEKVMYEDKCIYSSSLLLWDEDFDFSAITKEEIRDKVTRALDDESMKDVDVILSGVERDAEGRVEGATAVLSVYILKDRTNITNIQGQRIDPISEPWEAKFLDAIFHNVLPRPLGLEVYVASARSHRDGITSVIDNNRIYFVFGFVFITIYLAAFMGKFNLLQQRIYLGLATVLSIGMTILSAFGACLYVGLLPAELHNLMPFLILGIGIDDTLVIIQCLENVVNAGGILKAEERVGEALKQAGVSITITTLTDIFAFGVGATTKIPMLRSFCIFTAVGIFIVYVMNLIFIVPILSLDEKRRDAGREGCLCIQLPDNYKPNRCMQKQLMDEFFQRLLGPLIVKTPVKVVVVLVTVGLLGVNCWGLSGLTNEFDRSWFLDEGYLKDFLTALQELFPESGYRAEFYIGDVDYFRERESLMELYKRLDGLPGVRDGSVEFWYPAFLEYLKDEKEYPKTEAEFKDKVSTFLVFSKKGRKYLRDVQYTGNLLLDFNITASRGRYQHIHFNDGVEKRRGIDEVEEVLHSVRFRFRDAFRGCLGPDYLAIRSNQASDADLWSRSARRGPSERIEGGSADIRCLQVVSEELIKNLGLTLAGVFVVVLLMVGDLRVSLWVFTCILFTLIGIAGGIRFAGLTVEIMTSILMILSVGLAVDYSTHIAHKFMVTYSDSKDARVRITLIEIGPPVFNGGLTTMMAFMFCFWSTNYLFKVSLTVIWLSVIYGLYHGLIYLPVMLSWFGPDPFVDVMPSMKNSPSTDVLEMNLEDTEGGKLPIVPTKNYSTFSWKVLWKKSKGEYPMGSEPGHPQLEDAGGQESSPKGDRKEGCAVASYRQRRGRTRREHRSDCRVNRIRTGINWKCRSIPKPHLLHTSRKWVKTSWEESAVTSTPPQNPSSTSKSRSKHIKFNQTNPKQIKLHVGTNGLGLLLARRPWFFILASVALSSGLSSGLLFWRMDNTENIEMWFLPEAPLYQTDMWIQENFPEGVRYEHVIVAGPNVLTPEYFKYMAALDKKIRSVEAGGFAWVDVCARPDEFLEGKVKEKKWKRDTPKMLNPDESSVPQRQEDSNEDVFGGNKKGKEKVMYEDKCIYSSSLLLWDEDFDFSAITKEEIRDKITRALDDESMRDVDVILSGVERDAEGRVVGATAVLSVYILKDRTNITNIQGQRIDPISEPWEAKFLDAIFHNVLPRPLGLEVYVASARSYRDGITAVIDNNRIYFVLGFVFITIYLAASMGKFNFLQQRIYLGFATVLSIVMTILSAFGACLYVGLLPADLHNLTPFLILGIGIDDTFVIIQCLENLVNAGGILKAEERVGEALKQAGVSITITTLTDIFAFGVGATTKIPILRSFCIFTAVGIFIVYVMNLIFIVPILSLDEKRRDAGREGCLCIQLPDEYKPNRCMQKKLMEVFFQRLLGPLIVKTPVKVVVVLVTVGLLGVNCWGLSGLTNEFDRSWFLDKGYLREFLTALQELFPESGYRAEFYIGDVDYFRERESLLELYKRLDGLPGVRDGSVEFWYKAFMEYLKDEKEYPKTEAEFKDKVSTFLVFSKKGRKYLRDVQYTGNLLLDFNITASRGRYQHIHFNDGVEKRRGIDEVEEVLHSVRFRIRDAFRGCLGPDYLAIRTNQASDVVSEELIKNLGLTLAGVFVVVLLMVGDLRVSLWVFTCILFTLIGIAGGIRFAGLTVEIMTSILMILSVGLAVDYSTHIAHKFMVTYSDSKDARVRITLTETGPPVFNGGLTTMMAFMFCFWSSNYIFKVSLTWRVLWKKSKGEYPMGSEPGHPQLEDAGGHESPPKFDDKEGCVVASYRQRRGSQA